MMNPQGRIFGWSKQDFMAQAAIEHRDAMEERYAGSIARSIKNTHLYSYSVTAGKQRKRKLPVITVEGRDTVSAITSYAGKYHNPNTRHGKVAALNFASYTTPGGGYLTGSRAQEEALCHESTLYNVLARQEPYYAWNRQHLGSGMYRNRALYSPDVLFFQDNQVYRCDIITCAAPNRSGKSCLKDSESVNTRVLTERIKFVLMLAEKEEVDTLILGAWGCGVFGQNPVQVAELFRTELCSQPYGFSRVIFAIPKSISNTNFLDFSRVFQR